MEQQDLLSGDLKISDTVKTLLIETAKWARFLSVIGFVVVGLMIIAAFILPGIILSNSFPDEGLQPNFTANGIRINFFILAILLFFPCLYLFRFAIKMSDALLNTRQDSFEDSFQNLKSTLKFYGILAIVILSIYGLAFFVLLLTMLVAR